MIRLILVGVLTILFFTALTVWSNFAVPEISQNLAVEQLKQNPETMVAVRTWNSVQPWVTTIIYCVYVFGLVIILWNPIKGFGARL